MENKGWGRNKMGEGGDGGWGVLSTFAEMLVVLCIVVHFLVIHHGFVWNKKRGIFKFFGFFLTNFRKNETLVL